MPASFTIDDLREHLQAAVELELLVIPPYLCALYSLQPGSNLDAELIIRSVVVEEMLHMILAANVLNAIGGRPNVTDPGWVPRYPAALPHHEGAFLVGLLPFGKPALEAFLAIENPRHPVATLEAWPDDAAIPRATELARERRYATIGDFYKAIERGLVEVHREHGHARLFTGDRAHQIGPDHYYASAGRAIVVDDLPSAVLALEEIVQQGEGDLSEPQKEQKFEDQERDLAHYYRFNELYVGQRYLADDTPAEPTGDRIEIDWARVYRMKPNPTTEGLPTQALRAAAEGCNAVYTRLLEQIQTAFDGRPDELRRAVSTMFELKGRAIDLLRIRLPDSDEHAGPTFEYGPVPYAPPHAL